MDSQNEVIQPLEPRERKLNIEWPNKEDLLRRRTEYIKENLAGVKPRIKEGLVLEEGKELDELVNILLSAKFILLEMQRIAPIPLEYPIEIVEDFEYHQKRPWFSRESENGKHKFTIYLNSFDQDFMDGKEDLGVLSMAGTVHEFAHMIYNQEANIHEPPRKIKGIEEAELYQKYGRLTSWETGDESYLSLDIETRARLWQLTFLRHFFPDSKYVDEVKKELEIGRETRRRRQSEIIKQEEWKKKERKIMGFDD